MEMEMGVGTTVSTLEITMALATSVPTLEMAMESVTVPSPLATVAIRMGTTISAATLAIRMAITIRLVAMVITMAAAIRSLGLRRATLRVLVMVTPILPSTMARTMGTGMQSPAPVTPLVHLTAATTLLLVMEITMAAGTSFPETPTLLVRTMAMPILAALPAVAEMVLVTETLSRDLVTRWDPIMATLRPRVLVQVMVVVTENIVLGSGNTVGSNSGNESTGGGSGNGNGNVVVGSGQSVGSKHER